MSECNHKYVHLETIRYTDDSGAYRTGFIKIDRFFCEHCLEQREIKKEEWSRETPEWYRKGAT